MAIEIERKFLVTGNYKAKATSSERIVQGYLFSNPDKTVRIRIRGNKGYLTIKGASDEKGLCRYEFEQEIKVSDAEELLKLCEPGAIDKTRFIIPYDNQLWEVDEFYGANEGLIIAEIELKDAGEAFEKPDWLGKEVTGDIRFYNSMLTKNPFKNWKNEL